MKKFTNKTEIVSTYNLLCNFLPPPFNPWRRCGHMDEGPLSTEQFYQTFWTPEKDKGKNRESRENIAVGVLRRRALAPGSPHETKPGNIN